MPSSAAQPSRRLLLVGWDAADWQVITPLLDAGQMPALESLVNRGVMGNLASVEPMQSPMLWNSIATGKRADQHGILGFTELDPLTGAIRPVSSTSRRCKALWNITSQRGLDSHVVGWLAGHPAEPIRGVAVSDLFPYATAPRDQPWPLPAGAVHPPELAATMAALRMHPGDVAPAAILPFIPRAAEIDQSKDRRLQAFAKILAETCCVHNAATWILQNRRWDFLAVYFNGIDHFSHGFMHFHPPRLPWAPEREFELYRGVVAGAYRFHDLMLRTLLTLAGPDACVMLVSDHGFHSGPLRPRAVPQEPAGPTVQHRRFGVFVLAGPGIQRDERIHGATLLDVAPTALTLLGLPVGADMEGRVLAQAFETPPQIATLPSWERELGDCGMHPSGQAVDAAAAEAVLQQFAALGYIAPPDKKQASAQARVRQEQQFNLARVHLAVRRPQLALPILEALAREDPARTSLALHLAQCYLALRRRQEARAVLAALIARREAALGEAGDGAGEAMGSSAAAGREKDTRATVASAAAPAETSPAAGTALPQASPARDVLAAWADCLMGGIHLAEREMPQALACLLRAEAADPSLPDLYLHLGETYLHMRREADAARAFQRALDRDPDCPEAHLGLARAFLRRRRPERAVEEALHAVGLEHFLPAGHYVLGLALRHQGEPERARLALETAVAMAPGWRAARRALAKLSPRQDDTEPAAAPRASAAAMARGASAKAES